MNVEYAEDIGSVRGEVEKLREEIDEGREKFNTMETEYKKSLKTIQVSCRLSLQCNAGHRLFLLCFSALGPERLHHHPAGC